MLRLPLPSIAALADSTCACWAGRIAFAATAYIAAAALASALQAPSSGPASLLWLPSGMALALLLRYGTTMAPGIALGAFAVASWGGVPASIAVPIALGHAAAPALAAHLLSRHGLRLSLRRRRDIALLAALGAGLGALLGSANSVVWRMVGGLLDPHDVPAAALGAWLGDAAGVLLLTAPLLTAPRSSLQALAIARRALALLLALVISAAWLFGPGDSPAAALTPWLFVPHLLLCGLAVRGGVFAASLGALAVAAISALATARGLGPFADAVSSATPAVLSGYAGSLAATGLLVSALAGERAASDERWQWALDGSKLGVADFDRHTAAVIFSQRWLDMLGPVQTAERNLGEFWLRRTHDDDAARLRATIASLDDPTRGDQRIELRLRDAGQAWRWFDLRLRGVERSTRGRALRVIATLEDIGEHRAAEERQRLSASLFSNLREGLLITDAQYRVIDSNPAYSVITGAPRNELLGSVPPLLQEVAAPPGLWAGLRASGGWCGEVVERRRSGDPCTLRVTISTVRDAQGAPLNLLLAFSDITEQRLHREALEREKHFDELTRLPNRARLGKLLAEAMAASEREGFLLVVCHLDVDHFKPLNERFGRSVGDRVLIDLASRLRGSLRSAAHWADSVARIGGDEFALLLRAHSLDEARQAIDRVLRVFAQPLAVDPAQPPVALTASVGATVFPLDHADAETLLRHADHAMYGAKQAGRNGYLFFDPESSRRTEARVVAVSRVQEALEQGELELHYQPKVDLRDGRTLGVEALLRWNHPEHGLIGPTQFLPLIEHTALSAAVGDWVLGQAIEQLAQWHDNGLELSVSVNVSACHLQAGDFVERLQELLARHRPPLAGRLELEVLETAALADLDHSSALMERCRAIGVRFALDDFGTGYSNLTYLKRLPVDVLKLDRSFVHQMLTDAEDLAIVQGVIGLARTFDCSVVAEGVESAAQARRLLDLGCFIGQGLGIAAPMPAHEIPRWTRRPLAGLAAPLAIDTLQEAPALG